MSIKFVPVTKHNWKDCIKLKVKEEQKNFVASNAYSILESKFETNAVPWVIYNDNTMVGFMMWSKETSDDNDSTKDFYAIWRLMIDERYQGKGFGKESISKLIDYLKDFDDCREIKLSYEPENTYAEKIYESLGFIKNGEMWDDEVVSVLKVK